MLAASGVCLLGVNRPTNMLRGRLSKPLCESLRLPVTRRLFRNKYLYLILLSLIFVTFHLLAAPNGCFCNCSLLPKPIKTFDTSVIKRQPIKNQRTGSVGQRSTEKLTVENLEFNINISRSIRNSIEGNLWKPLKGYRSRCWVERLPGDRMWTKSPSPQRPLERMTRAYRRNFEYRKLLYNRTRSGRRWRMRCLPYAYVIGVTKSGTSDLYRYLMRHQQIAEAFTKEIHYWNARRFPRPVRLHSHETRRKMTFDQYLSHFDVAAHEINISAVRQRDGSVWHPKITVDGSIAMLWEDNGWTQIPGNRGQVAPLYTTAMTLAHFQPEARFIVLLREPVERLYSYYRMFTSVEAQKNPEVFHNKTMAVLEQYWECLKVYSIRECAYSGEIEKLSRSVNIRSSLYSTFLSDWLQAYGKSQFHVIRSEDYYANRRAILENAVKFLGLDRYLPEIAANLTDAPIVFKNAHYKPMLAATRRTLERFFQPFNKELEGIFGRTFWSYD